MPTAITPSELARSLADILNRAAYRDEVFEIERGGRRLVLRAEEPMPTRYTKEGVAKAYEEYRRQYPDPDPTFAEDMARARELVNAVEEVRDPWAP